MQIRKHSKYVFDVFQGTGFDGWTRIRKFHWGYKVVGGNRLTNQEMSTMSLKLEQFPNGNLENV
jgi:hypothetical protein